MEYSILSEQQKAEIATGTTKLVCYDYKAAKKAEIPPALIKSIESMEGRTFSFSSNL